MRTVKEVNFFKDETLRKKIFWLSMLILLVPLAFYILLLIGKQLNFWLAWDLLGSYEPSYMDWVLALVIFLVALPIHELIHAAFFKLFRPQGHITFGFSSGMFYAGCFGEIFTRSQICVVLLAPAVVITVVLAICAATTGLPAIFVEALVLHLSGCAGDFMGVWTIAHTPECTHCEDTDFGIRLLSDK